MTFNGVCLEFDVNLALQVHQSLTESHFGRSRRSFSSALSNTGARNVYGKYQLIKSLTSWRSMKVGIGYNRSGINGDIFYTNFFTPKILHFYTYNFTFLHLKFYIFTPKILHFYT